MRFTLSELHGAKWQHCCTREVSLDTCSAMEGATMDRGLVHGFVRREFLADRLCGWVISAHVLCCDVDWFCVTAGREVFPSHCFTCACALVHHCVNVACERCQFFFAFVFSIGVYKDFLEGVADDCVVLTGHEGATALLTVCGCGMIFCRWFRIVGVGH